MNRKLTTIWRIFLSGMNNFVRNAWLSAAAMAVMIITLTIVLFSVIANATFSYTVQTIRDKIDISVYLKDDVTDARREELVGSLKKIDNVKAIDYVSKEQALKNYVELNKDNIDLQLAISQTDNPLPASLQIKMHDPDHIGTIKNYLETPAIKALQSDQTSYSGDRKEAIDKIAKATSFIRKAGVVGVIVFALISVLIIFNTIQMAIFNRRDELSIMRLLGASKWYIRGPFLVESFLIGISSAVISVVVCNAVFSVANSTLNASSFGLLDITYANSYFTSHFWMVVGSQLALGIVIAVGSSFVATQRYLRIKHGK
ncbi:permease-like cell division protein FtsX [soil metagenome]